MKLIRGQELSFVPASHEDPQNPGVLKKILCSREDLTSGRVQMLNWARLPRGASFRRHYHEDMLEAFVIVRGTARMRVEDRAEVVGPQDTILVEPGKVHSMENIGNDDVEYIVFGITQDLGGKTVVLD